MECFLAAFLDFDIHVHMILSSLRLATNSGFDSMACLAVRDAALDKPAIRAHSGRAEEVSR